MVLSFLEVMSFTHSDMTIVALLLYMLAPEKWLWPLLALHADHY